MPSTDEKSIAVNGLPLSLTPPDYPSEKTEEVGAVALKNAL